ncbi:MAG: tetraacyldisaccharide 4'-kinase [Candidatus Latescibacter sp.]|nr:tetraacyldisaccharide 4'-kinase [Candidatus Latescibacter sp.]
MRKSIEDILYNRRHDPATLPLRAALRIVSLFYGAGIRLRNMLFDRKWLKTYGIPCRVISIGNITAGGTGKTPVTIMTARLLVSAGYLVAVVSRGYGRKSQGIHFVSDASGALASPAEAGDEPHLIASSLPGVPVVVGKDRSAAAITAFLRFEPDIILLDDAFQHRRLRRDADIVTLDAENPFGSGRLLPRGILRESPKALSRAQAVIVTRCSDDLQYADTERMVRAYNPGIAVFRSRHVSRSLRKPWSREKLELSIIAGQKAAALSNIGNPASFHRTLESLGAGIVLKRSMSDHHRYQSGTVERIREEALRSGADFLVMTAKDERNLPEDYRPSGRIPEYVLDIEAVLEGDEEKYLGVVLMRR